MYLLCAPQNQISAIMSILDEVEFLPLPLINLEFSEDKIKYIEDNIDKFDYMIISSPTVIERLHLAIRIAKHTIFITVGLQSAKKIKQLTKNMVIFPENGSGRDKLFSEKIPFIDFTNKDVLLVKGANIDGYDEIMTKYPKWKIADIYQKINLVPENKDFIKKLFTNSAVKGIIITTSILVDELFKLIESLECELSNIPFIVIHPKIRQKLESYGIKDILLADSANKIQLLDLIRSIDV